MDAMVTLTAESTGKELARGHGAVNAVLLGTGVFVLPRTLCEEPARIRALVAQPFLTDAENAQVKAHFLLTRERCLDVIAAAGRTPQVPGGGSMEGFSETLAVQHPQLWVIGAGGDYSAFFPYHRNIGEDGTGSDEVGQHLSGKLMRYRYDCLGGVVLTMSTTPDMGWLCTLSGTLPHGGVLSDTTVGSKVLVQLLGPERFWIRQASEEGSSQLTS